jgi:hypothetical protein
MVPVSGYEEQSIHPVRLQRGDLPFFEQTVLIGGHQDWNIVSLAGFEFDAMRATGPKGVGYAGCDETNDSGLLSPQTTRHTVGLVTESLDGLTHALGGLLAELLARHVVDDPRHRHEAYAGSVCNILYSDRISPISPFRHDGHSNSNGGLNCQSEVQAIKIMRGYSRPEKRGIWASYSIKQSLQTGRGRLTGRSDPPGDRHAAEGNRPACYRRTLQQNEADFAGFRLHSP